MITADQKKTTALSILDLKKKDLEGKKVLVRVDFNVPLKDGKVSDDTRIWASLPTLMYLVYKNAKIIIVSHLGRPKGERKQEFSLKPVIDRLKQITPFNIKSTDNVIGEDVTNAVNQLENTEILVLENIRFQKEEEQNEEAFSKQLAQLADIYVNDAFGCAHRAHCSTVGITQFLPSYMGCLLKKETEVLGNIFKAPDRPLVAIIGGSKISTKIEVLENLLDKVDYLIIGGAMCFTLLEAQEIQVGKSLVEKDRVDTAKQFLNKIESSSTQLIMPEDYIVADELKENVKTKVV